jgi:hypothetical protein
MVALRECRELGLPVETSPADALMGALWSSMGAMLFWQGKVRELDDSELTGRLRHVSGVETGEAKRSILIQLLEDSERRVADIASACVRAGVEARQVEIAERDAQEIGAAMRTAMAGIGLGDRAAEFQMAFAQALGDRVPPALTLIEGSA